MPDLDLVFRQPIGSIMMWSGLLADIPSGYILCDGNNGTPDLTARFVKGAPTSTEPGATGGEDLHTLTVAEMPSHNHSTFSTGGGRHSHAVTNEPDFRGQQVSQSDARGNQSPTGSAYTPFGYVPKAGLWSIGATGGSPHENRPQYFELAYIQRQT